MAPAAALRQPPTRQANAAAALVVDWADRAAVEGVAAGAISDR